MSKAIKVAPLLIDIEYQLRRLNLWGEHGPTPQSLASTLPFCVDTLHFIQWLQFVFLPRMQQLIDQQLSLPRQCAIAAMAEDALKGQDINSECLVATLAQLDQVLSD